MVREQCRHLLLGLQVLLLGISEAVYIVNVGIGSQTDKPVVGLAVLLAHEVDVIGRDDLHAMLFGQVEDDLVVLLLLLIHLERKSRNLRLVQHHLQIIVILEHPLVPLYGLFRACDIAVENHSRNLSCHTGGRADDVLVVLFNDLVRNPRLVVHTLDMSRGHDLHKILVPVVVLGQQDKVVIALLLDLVVSLGHVDFASDDRLYGRVLRRELEKLFHAVHVAVVSDRKTGHTKLFGSVEQVFDRRLAIKNRILGMDVKVYEGHNSSFVKENKVTKNSVIFPLLLQEWERMSKLAFASNTSLKIEIIYTL